MTGGGGAERLDSIVDEVDTMWSVVGSRVRVFEALWTISYGV